MTPAVDHRSLPSTYERQLGIRDVFLSRANGTFTEAALRQVAAAYGKPWRSVNKVGEALADVVNGRAIAARGVPAARMRSRPSRVFALLVSTRCW